jgi:hypothetical protein
MAGAANGTVAAQAAQEGTVASPVASRYRRREPDRTLLHATVRAHWKTFLAEVEERGEEGASLPRFVVSELSVTSRAGRTAACASSRWRRPPTTT